MNGDSAALDLGATTDGVIGTGGGTGDTVTGEIPCVSDGGARKSGVSPDNQSAEHKTLMSAALLARSSSSRKKE